jgi:hypothetical protein
VFFSQCVNEITGWLRNNVVKLPSNYCKITEELDSRGRGANRGSIVGRFRSGRTRGSDGVLVGRWVCGAGRGWFKVKLHLRWQTSHLDDKHRIYIHTYIFIHDSAILAHYVPNSYLTPSPCAGSRMQPTIPRAYATSYMHAGKPKCFLVCFSLYILIKKFIVLLNSISYLYSLATLYKYCAT